MNGFTDTIEELRAAGRVEAMEDLMSSLMDNLVGPCLCHWVLKLGPCSDTTKAVDRTCCVDFCAQMSQFPGASIGTQVPKAANCVESVREGQTGGGC